MNRITIVSVFTILTALTALASVGCIGESTTITQGTTEQEQKAAHSPSSPGTGKQVAEAKGQPVQMLELEFAPANTPPGTQEQGPFPEPWIRVMGPFPEPWHGKASEPAGSGNSGSGTDPNKP